MSVSDSVSPSRPHQPWRPVNSLLVLVALAGAAACTDESFRPGPSRPTPSSTIVYQTAPVEGVVREVGGGPMAGLTVNLYGVTASQSTTADGTGRFRFDGYTSRANQDPYITAYRDGYIAGRLNVPRGLVAPAPVSVELKLQPTLELNEGIPLHTTLSNDDVDYGPEWGPQFGLPVERGPVKVVWIRTTSRGPHILRAEWSSADRLSLWAEVYYKEVHVEGSGSGSAVVEVPADWTQDRLNPVTVSVGLPRTARDSGGLPGMINLTLSLTPKYPAP